MKGLSTALAALAAALPAGIAAGSMPRVVVSTIAGHPSAQVPGIAGATFISLSRPFRSPLGTHLVFKAVTSLPAESNDVLITGAITPGTVAMVVAAREGDLAPFAPDPGERLGVADYTARILDDGRCVFSANTTGGATASDEYVLLRIGAAIVRIAREDDPVPALPGFTYGCCLRSCNITNDGSIGFMAQDLRLGDDTLPDAHIFADSVLSLTGLTAPTGQFDGSFAPWNTFDADGLFFDASGESFIQLGTLTGGARIVALGNSVVLQSNFPIPGATNQAVVTNIVQAWMESDGIWFARGGSVDLSDWVLRNGAVIAITGAPVAPATTEAWQRSIPNTFRFHVGNNAGETAVAGNTDAPNTAADDVVVINGQTILLREGMTVDLNGNSLPDDNAIITAFRDDSAFITDAPRELFTVVTVRTTGGMLLGDALIRVPLPPICGSADFDGDGDTGTDDDIEAFLRCVGGSCCTPCGTADFDGDGDTGTDNDIEAFFRVLSGGTC